VAIGDGTEVKGLPQPPKKTPAEQKAEAFRKHKRWKARNEGGRTLKSYGEGGFGSSTREPQFGPYAPKFGPKVPKGFKRAKRPRVRRGRQRGERQSFGSYKSSSFGLLRKILRMVGAPSFALPKPSLSFGSTRLPSFSASLRSSGGRKADGRNHGFNKVKKRGRTGLGGR
jgi:hypothetical protein